MEVLGQNSIINVDRYCQKHVINLHFYQHFLMALTSSHTCWCWISSNIFQSAELKMKPQYCFYVHFPPEEQGWPSSYVYDHLYFPVVNGLFLFFPILQLGFSSIFLFAFFYLWVGHFYLWMLIVNYMFNKYFYLSLSFVCYF